MHEARRAGKNAATIVTIDRLTIDVALAALCVAFAIEVQRGPSWRLWLVMAAAALSRETGLLLITGYCGWLVWRHDWKALFPAALTAVPHPRAALPPAIARGARDARVGPHRAYSEDHARAG